MTTKQPTTDDQLAARVSAFLCDYVGHWQQAQAAEELGQICADAMREGARMKAIADLEAKRE
ncbi:MAG: hypothetical protein ACREA9_17465 [Pyrinomonadaceae bacterium]